MYGKFANISHLSRVDQKSVVKQWNSMTKDMDHSDLHIQNKRVHMDDQLQQLISKGNSYTHRHDMNEENTLRRIYQPTSTSEDETSNTTRDISENHVLSNRESVTSNLPKNSFNSPMPKSVSDIRRLYQQRLSLEMQKQANLSTVSRKRHTLSSNDIKNHVKANPSPKGNIKTKARNSIRDYVYMPIPEVEYQELLPQSSTNTTFVQVDLRQSLVNKFNRDNYLSIIRNALIARRRVLLFATLNASSSDSMYASNCQSANNNTGEVADIKLYLQELCLHSLLYCNREQNIVPSVCKDNIKLPTQWTISLHLNPRISDS